MAEFYRGKRVSVYRKQTQSGTDNSLTTSSPILTRVQPNSPDDRMRYMKNFRGMVTIYPGDATPYNNFSTGWIALVRYPSAETLTAADIRMEQSSLLHPVPYAMAGAPLTLIYDFKGITLGNLEELYFLVKPELSFGTVSCVWQMLWAQRDVVTPT